MRKSASRLLVFIFTFLMAWSMVVKPAHASIWDWLKAQFQSEEASENMETSITQEGVSGEKHVTETTSNLMNVINLHVLGPPQEASGETSMLRESIGPGLISVVNSGIVAMYDPPINSQIYLADLLQNAKILPQAQAQGLGFSSLDPILETWKNFRNIAYLFFVVIFLVIGFMIMFRAKIGQAAITVQQAIPSIIVALLAVTFSYAIAGFLIDVMYLLMFMLASLFTDGNNLISGNFFTLVSYMFTGLWGNMSEAVELFMGNLLGQQFFLNGVFEFLSTLSATVIVGLAILFATFKIFFELLKSYVSIILQVVFAPIILMVGAIPGKNTIVSWIKNLTGNLLMWPLVLICLLVNHMLTQNSQLTGGDGGGFMPPFLIGSGQGEVIPILVGIGILLVIPEIMKEAKKKLGVEEGIVGSLAGAAFEKTKKAFPLGGRVGLGTSGAIVGGAIGSTGGIIKNIPKAIGQMRTGDMGGGLSSIGSGFIYGLGGGIKKGASAGVNTAANIEHSSGLNQPDILNPITNFIDTGQTPFKSKPKTEGGEGDPISIGTGLASGKNRERAANKQANEEFADLWTRAAGKASGSSK